MSTFNPYSDQFGVAPGLEVAITHTENGLMLQARKDGQPFESYAPKDIETALAAAGHLIRGSQPPRGLFACRGTPVR